MSLILSTLPTTRPWLSRAPAGAQMAGRFMLHFGEMVLAMMAGMLIYMPVAGLIPTSLQQFGMALFMAAPMVAWMRIRGHGWRHGFEMALAMLVPWAAVVGLVGLGVANVLPWLAHASDPAMYLGMLGIMLVRRDHYAHGGAHPRSSKHSAAHPVTRAPRHFHPRRLLLAIFLDDPRKAWPSEQWPTAGRRGMVKRSGASASGGHLSGCWQWQDSLRRDV
jgi:hypothetical protein